jgi:type I restriction enzyme M protein
MAVSERGGKDNSGDYEYVVDEDGSLVEFPDGHPQAGRLVVDQDLVNYEVRREDLANAGALPDGRLCVAEAFLRFAQKRKLGFWEVN